MASFMRVCVMVVAVLFTGRESLAGRMSGPARATPTRATRSSGTCSDLTYKSECLEGLPTHGNNTAAGAAEGGGGGGGECAWCSGDLMRGCLDARAAYAVPRHVAKCRGARPPCKPRSCSELLGRSECVGAALEAGGQAGGGDDGGGGGRGKARCAWCEGDTMASCLDAAAASFIPGKLAKCEGSATPGADVKCRDLKDPATCLRGTAKQHCAWCSSGILPTRCLDEQAAKFLPPFIAYCELPSPPPVT